MTRVLAVIPSRFGSSRLPGKPLLPMLGGAPMIAHVVRAALNARSVNRVLVATDHEEIAAAAERAGAEAVMTDSEIETGTDRVAAAMRITQASADVVVNVQGDEPLIEPQSIDLAAQLLIDRPSADIATLSAPLPLAALLDPSKVKVVCSPRAGNADAQATPACADALFFSRGPIGVDRDTLLGLLCPPKLEEPHANSDGSSLSSGGANGDAARMAAPAVLTPSHAYACRLHVGLYAFRPASLLQFVELPPSRLERLERLEQMRALESGMRIVVGEVNHVSRGVDTLDDLRALEQQWRDDGSLRESLEAWLAAHGYASNAR